MTLRDQEKLISFLLETRVDFIPSLSYEASRYSVLNSLQDIVALVKSFELSGPNRADLYIL
jgi:hypothetical protein